MLNALDILNQNSDFIMNAYNLRGIFSIIIIGAVIDVILKGIGMWRAARMGKRSWFSALLVVNSMGLLPLVFLLITREEYGKLQQSTAAKAPPPSIEKVLQTETQKLAKQQAMKR